MHYSVTAESIATGAVANTFTTLLGIIAANTAGYRGRLRKLKVTPSGEAAQDVNVLVRLSKTNNAGAGTCTACTTSIKPKDANSRDSIMTGGKNYTVEPTTVDTPHFSLVAINGRGGWAESWDVTDAPCWGKNETLIVQCAPGTAAAVKVSITAEWEEY